MIDTGRGVQLAPVCRADIERLRGWRNHPAVWKWCRQNDLISDVAQEAWFKRQAEDPSIKMYLITKEELPVGVCGLTSIDLSNRRAEFSLYIAPASMKRGYGKKALSTLLDHAFSNLALNLVWGESYKGNPAIGMFKSIGFSLEGARRQFYFRGGSYLDAHLFSITAQEWKTKCSDTSQSASFLAS